MSRLLVSLLFMLSIGSAALAQDPIKVDPGHYKVEFENAQVRVLRINVGPGEKSIMHRHPNAVAIFLTDLNGKFTFPNGTTEERNSKAGDVIWTPATVHQPENVGTAPMEIILVELKSRTPARRNAHKPSKHITP